MNKTIILAVPYMYGLDKCIEKNLRFHGFNIINLCYDDRDSYYPHIGCRILGLYHKHIKKDGDYKKKLKYSRYRKQITEKLASLEGGKADYALCLRANIYPKEITRFYGARNTSVTRCFILQAENERTLFSFFNVGSIRLKTNEAASACNQS